MLNILYVGIFNDHELGGDLIFEEGFKQNKCNVERLDYRTIAKELGQEYMQEQILERGLHKDLIFIGKGNGIDVSVFQKLKERNINIALWYGDIRLPAATWLLDILKYIDFFFYVFWRRCIKVIFQIWSTEDCVLLF